MQTQKIAATKIDFSSTSAIRFITVFHALLARNNVTITSAL